MRLRHGEAFFKSELQTHLPAAGLRFPEERAWASGG